jgi:glycosyltransferase involved in cell wall biosynthesis
MTEQKPDISLVIPFLNEEGSLAILYEKIVRVLDSVGRPFEIVFIDDGSSDSSFSIVDSIARKDPRVIVIRFSSNRGKAAGLNKGFSAARGDIVFTLDADLQDDPEEIPNFLKKLDEGFDLVSGWKKKRHDPLEKRIPSKLFNKVTSMATGLKLHDFNCGFKAYRSEILRDVSIYGELHRYIPPLAHWLGYKVGEIPVCHHPREFGKSKYGLERYLRGFFDLFTVVLLTKFVRSPIYFFGSIGLVVLLFGLLVLTGLTGLQLAYGSIFGHRPLSYLAVLSILFGSQSLSLGLLAQLLTSISQSKGRTGVSIKNCIPARNKKRPADISIVIPVHNEQDNLKEMHSLIKANIAGISRSFEIIFVDDGSSDPSELIIRDIMKADDAVCLVQLRKRFGKAAALQAGFNYAGGDIIITMDGDLQDRPEEISRFLAGIDEGHDFVMGRRQGAPWYKSIFSSVFNRVASIFSPVRVHDINCGLKAFRRQVLTGSILFGEFQRIFPLLVLRRKMKVAEIPVKHYDRQRGVSKYGPSRIPKAFLDLLAVILLTGYNRRPLHLFGAIGLLTGLAGFIISAYLTFLRFATGSVGGHYTLLLVGVMLMVLGLQWFSTGIISELANKYFVDDQD